MTYSLSIENWKSDSSSVNNLEKWEDVIDYLRHKLGDNCIRVHIHKYSSNDRLLGELRVCMGNMWYVTNSPNDKILL